MIRITELSLPLDYPPDALRAAVLKRLQIRDADLLEVTLFKRSMTHARRAPSGSSVSSMCLCAKKRRCSGVSARDAQVKPAPDTAYHPAAQAPGAIEGTGR